MDSDQTRLRVLVDRAREHDPDAWEELYRGVYARLHAYARRRVAGDEKADDAVSEAFVRAMDAIDRFRWSASGFDGWMFGILRNVLSEQRRGERRRWRRGASTPPEPVDESPGALEQVLADERAVAVRRALDQLAPKDRELLELRIVGGLDAPAIAQVVGKREGAVRMAQSRALGRLEGLLSEAVR